MLCEQPKWRAMLAYCHKWPDERSVSMMEFTHLQCSQLWHARCIILCLMRKQDTDDLSLPSLQAIVGMMAHILLRYLPIAGDTTLANQAHIAGMYTTQPDPWLYLLHGAGEVNKECNTRPTEASIPLLRMSCTAVDRIHVGSSYIEEDTQQGSIKHACLQDGSKPSTCPGIVY